MFALVNAVVNTSIALPVKTRIAEGMSRAGASNTLKVVSYNVILGVIAVFSEGAIRQFCALALVVLVAHWFLVHTFFIAVLSIDIQRLEVCMFLLLNLSGTDTHLQLNELLRQNLSLMSSPKSEKSLKSLTHKTTWSKVRLGAQKIWTGRASRNLSLLMVSPCQIFLCADFSVLIVRDSCWPSPVPCTMQHRQASLLSNRTSVLSLGNRCEQLREITAHLLT
jgi:hypothetical protein